MASAAGLHCGLLALQTDRWTDGVFFPLSQLGPCTLLASYTRPPLGFLSQDSRAGPHLPCGLQSSSCTCLGLHTHLYSAGQHTLHTGSLHEWLKASSADKWPFPRCGLGTRRRTLGNRTQLVLPLCIRLLCSKLHGNRQRKPGLFTPWPRKMRSWEGGVEILPVYG